MAPGSPHPAAQRRCQAPGLRLWRRNRGGNGAVRRVYSVLGFSPRTGVRGGAGVDTAKSKRQGRGGNLLPRPSACSWQLPSSAGLFLRPEEGSRGCVLSRAWSSAALENGPLPPTALGPRRASRGTSSLLPWGRHGSQRQGGKAAVALILPPQCPGVGTHPPQHSPRQGLDRVCKRDPAKNGFKRGVNLPADGAAGSAVSRSRPPPTPALACPLAGDGSCQGRVTPWLTQRRQQGGSRTLAPCPGAAGSEPWGQGSGPQSPPCLSTARSVPLGSGPPISPLPFHKPGALCTSARVPPSTSPLPPLGGPI